MGEVPRAGVPRARQHALWRQEGRTGSYLNVNCEIFRDTGNPNLPRHALWRPGMTWDAIGELDPHTPGIR